MPGVRLAIPAFAAPDEQEGLDALLGLSRQGQELVVEKARVEGFWDGTPPAHAILDADLRAAAAITESVTTSCSRVRAS